MTYPRSLLSGVFPEVLLPPAADAAGRTSNFISLKGAAKVGILCVLNQGNAATVTLSILQATNVAGAGSKALANSVPIVIDLATGTSDSEALATAGVSYTTDAGVASKYVYFDLDPAQLDLANGYDCIGVSTGASNAANITMVMAFSMGLRFGGGVGALSQLVN